MRHFLYKSRRVFADHPVCRRLSAAALRRLLFISLLLAAMPVGGIQAFGLFEYGMLGAAGMAQGDAGITRSHDALSMRNNPALMALLGEGGISLEFARPQGLAGLDRASFAAAVSLSRRYGFAIGASVITSGDSVWRESDYGMSLSFEPFSALAFGATGRILHLDIAGLGRLTLPTFDIAFLFRPISALRIAGSAYAVTQARTGLEKGDYVGSTFRMACAYEALPGMILSAGAKLDGLGVSPSFGSEYALHAMFVMRACYETASAALTLGLGFSLRSYQVDISSRMPLAGGGMSHTASLAWSWGSEQDRFGSLNLAPININTAREKEIAALPGVNARLAERIVREREKRSFYFIDDVFRLPGFTRAVMKKIDGQIAVSGDGKMYAVITNAKGAESRINGYGIKELVRLGIRADTARRIVLFRKALRGFARFEDLFLMPESETNWIPLVFGNAP